MPFDFSASATATCGYTSNQVADPGVTWATMIAAAGTHGTNDNVGNVQLVCTAATTSEQWIRLDRPVLQFDTSALGNKVINAASLLLYLSNASGSLQLAREFSVYQSAPASPTNLVPGDYATFSATQLSETADTGLLVLSNYNEVPLNAAGIALISGSGITKLGLRLIADVSGSSPTWSSSASRSVIFSGRQAAFPPILRVSVNLGRIPRPNAIRPGLFSPGNAR